MSDQMGFLKSNLCLMAYREARQGLTWMPNSETTKYTKKFEPVFGSQRFSWCAAFVVWCLEMAGLEVPVYVPGSKYTFALCQAWEEFARKENLWTDKGAPAPGDIVLFDWDHDDHDDHMGILLDADTVIHSFHCAEGNVHNKTALTTRYTSVVKGLIRIPDGYTIPKEELVLS